MDKEKDKEIARLAALVRELEEKLELRPPSST
jgi:hypothetical protein